MVEQIKVLMLEDVETSFRTPHYEHRGIRDRATSRDHARLLEGEVVTGRSADEPNAVEGIRNQRGHVLFTSTKTVDERNTEEVRRIESVRPNADTIEERSRRELRALLINGRKILDDGNSPRNSGIDECHENE